jgi:hypothetical protein
VHYAYRFGFGVLVIYYWDQTSWELPLLHARFFQQDARLELANSCHLILLASLGLTLGSLLPVARKTAPRLWWNADYAAIRVRLLIVAPLLSAAFYLQGTLQVVGAAAGFGAYLLIVLASCCFFDSRLRADRGRWLMLVLVVIACALPVGFLNGQIGFMVAPAILVLFGFLLQRGHMPVKAVTVAAVLALMFVLPALTAYKTAAYTRGVTSFRDRLQLSQSTLEILSLRAARELALERTFARLAQSLPAVFYRYYPDVYPYDLGRSFAIELSTLWPRFLWPDKPAMSYELNRYTVGVGMVKEGDETAAVFDAVSEYYVNFGLAGVFVMSIVHGYYIRWLGSQFNAHLHWAMAGAMNIGLLLSNPEFFGIVQVFVAHTRVLPVWLIILYVVSRRRRPAFTRVQYPVFQGGLIAGRN